MCVPRVKKKWYFSFSRFSYHRGVLRLRLKRRWILVRNLGYRLRVYIRGVWRLIRKKGRYLFAKYGRRYRRVTLYRGLPKIKIGKRWRRIRKRVSRRTKRRRRIRRRRRRRQRRQRKRKRRYRRKLRRRRRRRRRRLRRCVIRVRRGRRWLPIIRKRGVLKIRIDRVFRRIR